MNPPDNAIVLSVDEKSQIQAWIAPSRYLPSDQVCRSAKRTIISVMERPNVRMKA